MRCPDRDRDQVGGPERVTDYGASAGWPVRDYPNPRRNRQRPWGRTGSDDESRQALERAVAKGGKLFDTAYTSGKGHSWSD